MGPPERESRPVGNGPAQSISTAIKSETSLAPSAPEVTARRSWSYRLVSRCATPPPIFGTREWLELPEGTPAKIASVVVAAESWARELDDLPERLEHELDERRRAEKAAEDAEYQARAAAHRRDWRHLRVVEPYADRRDRELAEAIYRPADADGRPGGEPA